jgi:hypothetical protein
MWVRIFQIIFSLFAIEQLVKMHLLYKHLRYITYPAICFAGHVLLIALMLLVDEVTVNTTLLTANLYNQWSAFIRLQAVSSLGIVTFVTLRKLKNGKKFK